MIIYLLKSINQQIKGVEKSTFSFEDAMALTEVELVEA